MKSSSVASYVLRVASSSSRGKLQAATHRISRVRGRMADGPPFRREIVTEESVVKCRSQRGMGEGQQKQKPKTARSMFRTLRLNLGSLLRNALANPAQSETRQEPFCKTQAACGLCRMPRERFGLRDVQSISLHWRTRSPLRNSSGCARDLGLQHSG